MIAGGVGVITTLPVAFPVNRTGDGEKLYAAAR